MWNRSRRGPESIRCGVVAPMMVNATWRLIVLLTSPFQERRQVLHHQVDELLNRLGHPVDLVDKEWSPRHSWSRASRPSSCRALIRNYAQLDASSFIVGPWRTWSALAVPADRRPNVRRGSFASGRRQGDRQQFSRLPLADDLELLRTGFTSCGVSGGGRLGAFDGFGRRHPVLIFDSRMLIYSTPRRSSALTDASAQRFRW